MSGQANQRGERVSNVWLEREARLRGKQTDKLVRQVRKERGLAMYGQASQRGDRAYNVWLGKTERRED